MEGLNQIENKKYYLSFTEKEIKNITFIGMAFYKKFVKIKYKDYL